MSYLMLWLNAHRAGVVWVIAFFAWTGPYTWYFRVPLKRWWLRSKRHNWSVDMVQKRAIYNGKEELR